MSAFVLQFRQTSPTEFINSHANEREMKLVEGLKAGQKSAIEQLYKMYASSLLGVITRIVKYDEVAEDILQDTFLKIWKSVGQYDPSKGRLFTWMVNLARNTAIDQVRSKYYTNQGKTDDINEVLVDDFNHQQTELNPEIIGVKQLVLNLKSDQKAILDLFYFEGYTHTEVAEKLDIPLGTVKTKIRLSILALRKYFNETNETYVRRRA